MRRCYLAALVVVQLAFIVELASPLARALSIDAVPGIAPDGWLAMSQLALSALAIAGASIALVFPGLVLSRHRREGRARYAALPRPAVAVTIAGSMLLAAAAIALSPWPIVADVWALPVAVLAPFAVGGGLALATAGVLSGELLVGVIELPLTPALARRPNGRIEVTYPPELCTRARAAERSDDRRLMQSRTLI